MRDAANKAIGALLATIGLLLLPLLTSLLPASAAAQDIAVEQAAPDDPINGFNKIIAMVEMRDGVKLNTEIYVPKVISEKLPIIFWRSPYGVSHVGAGSPGGSVFGTSLRTLVEDKYIFVFQDIRGRHRSEGDYVLLRPRRSGAPDDKVDEATDAHDTIEWLLANLPANNGRVGMMGVSYPAWLAAVAATDPHPALKAVAPIASPYDVALTDDLFHNGAFRLSYAFEWVAFTELNSAREPFKFETWDTFSWYLGLGSLANLASRHLDGYGTIWSDFVAHPAHDAFWKRRAMPSYGVAKVPSLNVGGWQDSEDRLGPARIFQHWSQEAAPDAHLVLGPWIHGGALGQSETAAYYQKSVLAPWFASHLKGKPTPKLAPVMLFETGSDSWVDATDWPTSSSQARKLYLVSNGKLSFTPPQDQTAFDTYISDPARPVPYRPRPIENMFSGPGWSSWQAQDQRFSEPRPDVLSWVSEPLKEDLVLSGSIVANIFAATSGTDSDWVVKLIDVHPDEPGDPGKGGFQSLISSEILRGRYRDSLEIPSPIPANSVQEYRFELPGARHRFRKGHRMMVQIQSSWFPLYDRNPQKYVPNIFLAKDSDFVVATQSIYRDEGRPSHLLLDVIED